MLWVIVHMMILYIMSCMYVCVCMCTCTCTYTYLLWFPHTHAHTQESIPDPEVQYADMPKGLQEYALERWVMCVVHLIVCVVH
jgi:hypothetical protein